mgnify:FL=1
MIRILYLIIGLCVAVVMSSCHRNRLAQDVLNRADSMMEEHADSAMSLLRRDSVVFLRATQQLRMAYILSKTEAEDKLYITHRSDSAMQLAVKYFDRHGTALQRTRAWYLLGRVYCDMLLYGNALTAFDAALAVQPDDDSTVCRYKARACSWAGYVYEEKNLHKDALRYNKMAYAYARKADVPTVLVYSLRDIGRSYCYLNEFKIGIQYYRKSAITAKSINAKDLYEMVMYELAGVYTDAGMSEEAHDALCLSFSPVVYEALASYYFIWADYYRLKGMPDSAIVYNKKGMTYGLKRKNKKAALDVARLYAKTGNKDEAIRFYETYSAYVDSVDNAETVQYGNILSRMEQMFDVERQNVVLADTKLRLTVFLYIVILVVFVAAVLTVRYLNKRKAAYRKRQESIDQYWCRLRNKDLQTIQANEKRIAELEKELSSSTETLTEIRKKLIETEVDMLGKQNEQILSEQRHKDVLVDELEASEIYKRFHTPGVRHDSSDYLQLKDALNTAYNRFTHRLEELYPEIRYEELYICCLVKIKLASKEICSIMDYKANKVGMTKTRLYQKIFKVKGSVADFDNFIRNF